MMFVGKINVSILCTLCENAFLNTTVGTWRFESSLQLALTLFTILICRLLYREKFAIEIIIS